MSYPVEIKTEAHQDTLAAYLYYEDQQLGLGERFLEALNETYLSIAEHPTHYGYIAEDPANVFRDLRLKQFPYVVVYEMMIDRVIVYAVFHARRKPESKMPFHE